MAINVRKALAAMGLSAAVVTGGVFVSQSEGLRLQSYPDPVEIYSACYGHTGPDVVPGKTYTEHQCLELLAKDLTAADSSLIRLTKQVQLSDGEHAAYLSFIYNVGQGNFSGSTLRKDLLAGDRVAACNELTRWVYASGKKLPGLVERRARERDLCLDGVNNVRND